MPNLPKSAADFSPTKKKEEIKGEILVIVGEEKFLLSVSDALTLAGTITAQVNSWLKHVN